MMSHFELYQVIDELCYILHFANTVVINYESRVCFALLRKMVESL